MDEYLIKVTNVYRVPTVEDALTLRERLQMTPNGELTAFSYTTKYIKSTEEEYQVVKATIVFTEEKNPDIHVTAKYDEGVIF